MGFSSPVHGFESRRGYKNSQDSALFVTGECGIAVLKTLGKGFDLHFSLHFLRCTRERIRSCETMAVPVHTRSFVYNSN